MGESEKVESDVAWQASRNASSRTKASDYQINRKRGGPSHSSFTSSYVPPGVVAPRGADSKSASEQKGPKTHAGNLKPIRESRALGMRLLC